MRLCRARTNQRQHCFLRRRRRLLFSILESKRVILAWTPSSTESWRDSATGCSFESMWSGWKAKGPAQLASHKVSNNNWVSWRLRRGEAWFVVCAHVAWQSLSSLSTLVSKNQPKKSPLKKRVCMTTRPQCEGGRGGRCFEHLGTNYYFNLSSTQISAPTSRARTRQ